MLRKVRLVLATLFFVCITMLFLDFTGTWQRYVGWMAKIQFLPALLAMNVFVVVVLILLTLIFGRIYCSVICPLGVMQDIVAWIGKRSKRNPYTFSKEKTILRYVFLVVFILAFVLGINVVVSLFAPYSSYGRIAGNLLKPVYEGCNNLLALIAEHFDSYAFYSTPVWIRSLSTFVIAIVTFIVIAILAWRNGRTYCNTICPVGTVLSWFARFSWFKIVFDVDKCRNCSACSKNCKASCIDYKNHVVDYSRCVVCGDCIDKCRFDALHYAHAAKKKLVADADTNDAANNGRRSFLMGLAAVTTTAAMSQANKKVDGGLAELVDMKPAKRDVPLTPPGSISAFNMAMHCTACQLCVSECPNGVLRPSTDFKRLMQPTMSFEKGYCRPECTRCSRVCPTGAILSVDRAEKSSIQIGHAVWIKKNCVVITDDFSCGNCARHCPSGAISMIHYDNGGKDVEIPAINTERCIGCGACENLCPARPFTAIYVEGHEQHKTI